MQRSLMVEKNNPNVLLVPTRFAWEPVAARLRRVLDTEANGKWSRDAGASGLAPTQSAWALENVKRFFIPRTAWLCHHNACFFSVG